MSVGGTIALVLAGIAWWTLLEYVLHRWAFHTAGRFIGKRHLKHHAQLHVRRLAIAPVASMVVGLAIHAAVFFGLGGVAVGAPLMAGLVVGYAAYEWVHWSTHYRVARTPVGKWQRAYHLAHHHRSPGKRFGVTSPVWDWVFGTYEPAPRRKAA